jgi:hypothetical protein
MRLCRKFHGGVILDKILTEWMWLQLVSENAFQLLDSSEILESFYKEARKLGDLQKSGATLQVLSNTAMGLQSLD